ncbi:hypothetical protein ACIOC2_01825 [Streptomyces sp. NPDC088337]|uniref:hypothetical protein n=1 Tax=unclassified Streptomyces TaxID=2593676 RepID=UPI000C27AADC|nr:MULTISPECIES: hypothetical protein [unclassified Streptomyces]PJM94720.1 hypothetical protein CG719_15180 [Streptomyces sp. CB01373]WSB26832.1 hypothetical protein OIE49_13505 [Streptomyces sp. NBC_01788]
MDSGAIRRRPLPVVAVLTGAVLLAFAAPGTARAAATACAGREVRTVPFATGTIHVHKRDGYVCALTVATKPGSKRPMSVTVQARGNRPVTDKGRYSRHAGPVTVHAGHRCVRVAGSVGSKSVHTDWILC